MNIPLRKWVALAVCSSVLGAGLVLVVTANDKPAKEDWLPKPRDTQVGDVKIRGLVDAPPSMFPDLAIPEGDPKDPKADEKREEQFQKLCPRLCGKVELKIEPTDDMLRKLLKARLHQGVWEMIAVRKIISEGSWNSQFTDQVSDCLGDMRETAVELFAGQPKELTAWLEELVVQTKERERFTLLRVQKGVDPPQRYTADVRDRLKAEEALVKAKKK
jgi:hypothetical protein